MKRQRLAVVTRRFWPHFGSLEHSVGEAAAAIKRAGHDVEILTVRWERSWPSQFAFREMDVMRLGRPGIGPWGTFRFVRTFSRFIRDADYDRVLVFGLHDESWAAIRSCVRQLPVVVRIRDDDLVPQDRNQFNNRQLAALENVQQILVDFETTANRLVRHNNISPELISVVPGGVEVVAGHKRTSVRQNASRIALSDAHPILLIEAAQPLVVCGAPIHGDRGIIDLVEAWPFVLERNPHARLWILGDGPEGRAVWDRVCDLNLADSIIMPGFFDALDEVLQAADVYVHPLRSDGGSAGLMQALAWGVCTIATQTGTGCQLIEKNVNGLLAPAENPRALAEAINLAINSSDIRDRLGRAAGKRAGQRFRLDDFVKSVMQDRSAPQPEATSKTVSPRSGAAVE